MFKIIKIGRNKMKEEIWDGEMDYGWEDLAEKVRIVSNNFAACWRSDKACSRYQTPHIPSQT